MKGTQRLAADRHALISQSVGAFNIIQSTDSDYQHVRKKKYLCGREMGCEYMRCTTLKEDTCFVWNFLISIMNT